MKRKWSITLIVVLVWALLSYQYDLFYLYKVIGVTAWVSAACHDPNLFSGSCGKLTDRDWLVRFYIAAVILYASLLVYRIRKALKEELL
jgi:membrane protein DedA with SNARE-associated domain